jgi:hypothetical protein
MRAFLQGLIRGMFVSLAALGNLGAEQATAPLPSGAAQADKPAKPAYSAYFYDYRVRWQRA